MDDAAISGLLTAATAGCAPEMAQRLMLEVTDAAGLSGDPEREADDAMRAAAALQMMAAATPRDPLEAMLAAQMAAAHGAAMRAMKRAAECAEYPQIEALYARQASRLMQLFMRQMEALERRRALAAKREASEAAAADPMILSRAARRIAKSGGVRAKRTKRPPERPPARCNGKPAPRNGRHVNGTGPPP